MMNRVIGLLLITLTFIGCDETDPNIVKRYDEGVFVVNEGIFGQTSGTVSYYDRSNGVVEQKIFEKVNNRDLGDVVQSLYFYNGLGYVVVNNSNKIEVVDASTFEEQAQVTGLNLPRYILPISNSKAYVSEWGADGLTGTIAVLDLVSHTITNRIAVSQGPEHLLVKFDKLYVTHSGGYGDNNKVSVINTTTDQVERVIDVYDKPNFIVSDDDANIWVACAGKVVYTTYPTIDTANSTESALVKISPSTYSVIDTVSFGKGNPVSNLTVNTTNENDLYYSRAGKIWKYTVSTNTETQLFAGSFYGLGFDPASGYLYATTSSGVNAAYAKRYQTDGTLVDSFQVGVFANGFVFK